MMNSAACFQSIHPFPGASGIFVGFFVPCLLWAFFYRSKKAPSYDMDPKGVVGAFEPFLARYLRLSEAIVGLSTGSIVLLIGSSVFHSQSGHLPWFYASPLFLLAFCILYATLFSSWIAFQYEGYRHGDKYMKYGYAITETLGFSSLVCFVLGYMSLIFAVTR
jgi:hypothetical protein